jgi:ferric-dicitrate binding protein FerR (iron transport regulator)
MKTATVMPATGPGAEALIREARRRQRRRYAATALAVAAVLGAFAALYGAGGPRQGARPGASCRPFTPRPRRYLARSRRVSARPC